jgi:hypothetical protein
MANTEISRNIWFNRDTNTQRLLCNFNLRLWSKFPKLQTVYIYIYIYISNARQLSRQNPHITKIYYGSGTYFALFLEIGECFSYTKTSACSERRHWREPSGWNDRGFITNDEMDLRFLQLEEGRGWFQGNSHYSHCTARGLSWHKRFGVPAGRPKGLYCDMAFLVFLIRVSFGWWIEIRFC